MPNPSNKTTALFSVCLLGSVVSATALPAKAVNVKAAITVDNSYALYYGTGTAATNYVGNDFTWQTTEVYNFSLPSNNYLYLVTVSDISSAQGLIGQFENLDTGYKFYSNDPQWQVTATGLRNANSPNYGAPYTGTSADLSLLTAQILAANGGGNPSNGWVATTAGPANGSFPWGQRPSIDSAARWVWHSSNGDTDPTTPGFNHDEWLVFRIRIGSTPEPVPGPLPVLGAASAWAWSRRLRSRIRSLSS